MSGGFYLIWLSDTHYYGGRTKDFTKRWAKHLGDLKAGRHCNLYMQHVFAQQGVFRPVVVEVADNEVAQQVLEQTWLNVHYGQLGCLNLSQWADRGSNRGRVLSQEHRRRISEAHKGKKMSTEARQNMSVAQRKRKATAETKSRMSAAHKNKLHSEESKRKMSEIAKARGGLGPKKHSEATRQKMSDAHRARYARRKTSNGNSES